MRKTSTLAITLLIFAAGCTKTVINTVTVTLTAPSSGLVPTPSLTPAPSPTLSDQDVNDIETVVRSYFDGLVNADVLAGANTRAQWSTMDLHDWAG